MRVCTISGCGKAMHARNWCMEHYNNWYRHGDPARRPAVNRRVGNKNQAAPIATRFWSRVDFSDADGCWTWRATRQQYGYGEVYEDGRRTLAHRLAYELVYGDLEPDEVVAHHCDNPPCVRPDHLFAGSQADNMADCGEKERWRNQYTAGANHPLRVAAVEAQQGGGAA